MRRRFKVLLLAAGLVGCGGDKISKPNHDSGATFARAAAAPPVAKAAEMSLRANADMAQSVALPRPSVPGRKIIRNTTLSLQVKDADVAIPLIDSIARKHDVVIGDAQVARQENKRQSAHYVLHVPAPEFDATLDAVRALGDVQRESGAAEDVTKAYTDLETRITVKESTVQRLQALLVNRTAKLSDVLQVEQEVGRAVTELEQMKGERRFYDTQVAMATITVDIAEPFMVGATRVTPPVSIALRHSLDLLGESAARVAYFTAFMAPWVVLASLLLWGAYRLGSSAANRHSTRHLTFVSLNEGTMKKKGRPNIPDFSKKKPSGGVPQASKAQQPTRVAAPAPMGKPQSTSAKSGGRRGT